MDEIVSSNTRAAARYNLVQEILKAPNFPDILDALNDLGNQYGQTFEKRAGEGKEESAVKWLHSASEIATLLACAVYNLEDQPSA